MQSIVANYLALRRAFPKARPAQCWARACK